MEAAMTQEIITSPGQLVQHAMTALEWSQSDLAFALGTTTAAVSQILADKRGISHNMAQALAAALMIPAEDIATAQALWDLRRADRPDDSVSARARILARYPLRDMIKRGWIDPENPGKSIEEQICTFFGVSSLDDVPHLAHSAKKTQYETIPATQLAWLFRVHQIAKEISTPRYDASKLSDVVEEFKDMRSDPTLIRRVPQMLSTAGVRFVVVECLVGSKIDGVCLWLDEKSPVIGLSLRFDRIDNFWFVLRHECSHVLHGHGKGMPIVDSDVNNASPHTVSEEECVANKEAADFCVNSQKMESFYLRKKPFFPDREIVAFAKINRTHPGLVVGQIQKRMERYDLLRQHLVKIKTNLAGAMMFDGWGDVVPTQR